MKESKLLTDINTKLIITGALKERFNLVAQVTNDFNYAALSIAKGDYVLACKTAAYDYSIKIYRKSQEITKAYQGCDVNLAAGTYILLVGAKEAIKSAAKAVKLYEQSFEN
jgi:hypothetical protein